MSGFFSASQAIDSAAEAAPIANDGWWPDLRLDLVRERVTLDGTVPTPKLKHAVIDAAVWANRQMRAWRDLQVAAGHASLAAVPGATIEGQSERVQLYHRAVASRAAGALHEAYRSYDSSDAGLRRAQDMDPRVSEHYRDATDAVRAITGTTTGAAELI